MFDLAFIRQRFAVSERENATLAVQLSRWEKKGMIIRLRRGLYALADRRLNTLEAANRLVEPSYISGEYALSYYGLIQDAAFEVTSACLISPRRNSYGIGRSRYSFRQVKVFKSFKAIPIDGNDVLFATPEKALLDTWHWSSREWTQERHREMRYEDVEMIDLRLLKKLAEEFPPRVSVAAQIYIQQAQGRR